MTSINLLPTGLRIKYPVAKITQKFKKIVVVEVMLLVFIGVVAAGSILILSNKLNDIKKDSENIKNSIKNLEATEHKLVLVQDRAVGIDHVFSNDSAYDEFSELQGILDSLPVGSTYSQVFAGISQIDISVQVGNAIVASRLFDLIRSANFSTISVSGFSTTEAGGYQFTIAMIR